MGLDIIVLLEGNEASLSHTHTHTTVSQTCLLIHNIHHLWKVWNFTRHNSRYTPVLQVMLTHARMFDRNSLGHCLTPELICVNVVVQSCETHTHASINAGKTIGIISYESYEVRYFAFRRVTFVL